MEHYTYKLAFIHSCIFSITQQTLINPVRQQMTPYYVQGTVHGSESQDQKRLSPLFHSVHKSCQMLTSEMALKQIHFPSPLPLPSPQNLLTHPPSLHKIKHMLFQHRDCILLIFLFQVARTEPRHSRYLLNEN